MADFKGRRVETFYILIPILAVFDAYFTIYHLARSPALEMNPLMAYALEISEEYFFAAKYAVTALAVALLSVSCNRRAADTAAAGVGFVYGILGAGHLCFWFMYI